MFTIKGFYNDAVVYAHASDVDQGAIDQIKDLRAPVRQGQHDPHHE